MSAFLSKRERSKYSLVRAIECGRVRNTGSEQGLEADASRAARGEYGADLSFRPEGIIVPGEVILGDNQERLVNFSAQQRTLTASNFAQAGALVGEEQESVFSKYLFPASIVFGLGANFLGGLTAMKGGGSGTVSVPRITTANEGEWLGEYDAASTARDLTAALTTATPRRVVATQVVSNQLLKQGAETEAVLWRVLLAGVAAAIDRAALAGIGGKQPLGLLGMPGVGEISLGTDGGAPTLAALNSAEAAPLASNVPLARGGYAVSVNARTKLKNSQKATGTSTYLLETADGRDYVNGFRGFGTKLLPDTLTKGSGTNLGSIVFGADWSNLSVVQWAGIEIVSDPYTLATGMRTILTVTVFLDIVSPAPAAFARCRDVVTS
jgi:HK97 family phage major capsid protein